MSAFRYRIPLTITLRSPFVTRGLVVDRATVDTPLARNAKHEFILPGSLVRGVVRAALATLAEHLDGGVLAAAGTAGRVADDIDALFGRGSGADRARARLASQQGWLADNEPARGLLSFDDLVADPGAAGPNRTLARIQLDGELGSVREGFLQVIELPFALGQEVKFQGTAQLRAGKVVPGRVQALLEHALALVPAIGAVKSAGFGRVVSFEVGAPVAVAAASAPAPATPVIGMRYLIDRPFLVAAEQVGGNLFRGQPVIPGAAIKGTLANALADAGWMDRAMGEALSTLTISHAFPRPRDSAGLAWLQPPKSLAVATQLGRNTSLVVDQLLADDPNGVVNGRLSRLAFAPDWKDADRQVIKAYLGQACPLPDTDVRTRTKIAGETGTSAYEAVDDGAEAAGQLFSYSAVVPDQHEWVGLLVPDPAVDPAQLARMLGLLAGGLCGFGKTDAVLTGTVASGDAGLPAAAATPIAAGDPRYAVTLLTPALLNDLQALRTGRLLLDDYRHYWQQQGFRLLRFFATQRLEGGYVALRYPQRADRYEPYLVTEPGAVFLIEADASTAAPVPLADLLRDGLPPNPAIAERDWRRCPYLPQNGFGMIRCNLVDHVALAQQTWSNVA
jgi:hypothetical protein